MRLFFAFLLLACSYYFWSNVAEQVALRLWGRQASAMIYSVSKFGVRMPSYTGHYRFTTEEQTEASGSCLSKKNAEGRSIRILYLQNRPDVNVPLQPIHSWLNLALFGIPGFLLTLWSGRVMIRRPKRLGGYGDSGTTTGPATDPSALHEGKPAVYWGNRWKNAAALACLLAAVVLGAALGRLVLSTQPSASGERAEAVATRGSSAGNAANGNLFGFEAEWLYLNIWKNYENAAAPAAGLYRCLAADGSKLQGVGKPGVTEKIFQGISVLDGFVYYTAMDGVKRIRTDGSGHKTVIDTDVSSVCVVGDHLYYQPRWDQGQLWRAELDGGGEKRIVDERLGCYSVASDGYIYYSSRSGGGMLHRRLHDGRARLKISDVQARLVVAEQGLLWVVEEKTGRLLRMKPDGSDLSVIIEEELSTVNFAGGKVFALRGKDIVSCSLEGGDLGVVAETGFEDPPFQLTTHKDRLYLRSSPTGDLLSFALDGSDRKVIAK